jgi:nucleotide-binding universal stress UspA family protein
MKNIVIFASLNEESLELIKTLKDSPLLKDNNLIIAHCFEIQPYVSELSPYFYPSEDQYPEIESATTVILKNLATALGRPHSQTKVFFSFSSKQRLTHFLKEANADLAIVATRGKHGIEGLFSSSFSDHLIKYSPCDIYILRPQKDA